MLIEDNTGISFSLIIDDTTGLISGFTLKAISDDNNAKLFCIAFPGNMTLQRARIFIKDEEIVFKYEGITPPHSLAIEMEIFKECELRVKVKKSEAEQLSQLLTCQVPYLFSERKIRYEFKEGFGFTLYVNQKPDQIVIVNAGSDTLENCPPRLQSDFYSSEK